MRDAIAEERVGGRRDARPALTSFPAPGSLLVVARSGAWVVRADGTKRRLGAYEEASWSPHGLHVVLADGPRLVAATPAGDVRWTLSRRPRVVGPRWSSSGYRIAYGVGSTIRVVNGDGEPDRLLVRNAVPRSWAWSPDVRRNLLAYVTRTGAIAVVDVDTRERLWRWNQAVERADEVAWSADGRRLVARAPHALYVFSAGGRLLTSVPPAPPEASRSLDIAFAPAGRAFAVTSRDPAGRSRIVLLRAEARVRPRAVFGGEGRLGELAWSPDGRWLLATWPSADQWLFLRMPRVRRIVATSEISREFDPGGGGTMPAVRLGGWCCPP